MTVYAADWVLPWTGRSPERVLFTLVQGDIRYEKGTTDWLELIDAAPGAPARMLAAVPAPLHRLV